MEDHSNPFLRGFGSILNLSESERQARLLKLEQNIARNSPCIQQPWLWSFGYDSGTDTPPGATPVVAAQARATPVSLFDSFRKKRRAVAQAASPSIPRPIQKVSLAVHRLVRFQHVLKLASTAPWCNLRFNENERMTTQLIASHLGLIIGDSEWKQRKGDCFSLIDSTADLSKIQNVCWVTNRQQGKTSTLSRFLACLAFTSVKGGNLCCVYSTSLDRSCELVKAAKKFLYWFQTDTHAKSVLSDIGMQPPVFVTDNERAFGVRACGDGCFNGSGDSSPSSVINTIIGRPKSSESCRGDAPACAFFDEIGFVNPDFWWSFAFPLLQIGGRVFTMATTPAPLDSFFDTFAKQVREENARGHYFFYLTNHALTCQECLDNGFPEKCSHKLYLVPPWKSVVRFESLRRLVPQKRREEFSAEVFGVLKRETANYFPPKIVEASLHKTKSVVKLSSTILAGINSSDTSQVVIYVVCDPASHQKSSMGIAAIANSDTGQIILLGTSEVPVRSSAVLQVQMILERFVTRLLSTVTQNNARFSVRRCLIVPIVETNNNDVVALSLVTAIRESAVVAGAKACQPFQRRFFGTAITDNIGVLTTESNKMAMIQQTYSALFEARVVVARPLVTIGPCHLPRYEHPTPDDALALLRAELIGFRETPKGPSGKASDRNDDAAMAFMMGLYWSYCVRATASIDKTALEPTK